MSRFRVNGYIEEGTTTTPFALLAMNGIDRFHVVIQAVRAASPFNRAVASAADLLVAATPPPVPDDWPDTDERAASSAVLREAA